jgi:hypothetical protein
MKLKVTSYDEHQMFHRCVSERGEEFRVDIQVDGSLRNIPPADLVGRTVEVGRLDGYIYIASDVSLTPADC